MGWSDYTTEDKTALTSVYNMIHCLELAYNERAVACGLAPLAFTTRFTSLESNDFCAYFDRKMDYMIALYLKEINTINGGLLS